MSRLFLTLVCGPGSLDDLHELWEPIKQHFDGLCAVCHADYGGSVSQYLAEQKGAGHITYLPYTGRHDLSRIAALHCGAIQDDDIVVQFDTLERLSPQFAAGLRDFAVVLADINAVFYYGKILLYRYHESITFRGTPHEGWIRQDGRANWVELSGMYPNEADIRLNVRPLKRTDPYHWVGHYVRYYLGTPWGANHCLLGNEHRGDPMKLYQEREALRIEVRDYLRAQGVPLTDAGLKQFLTSGDIPAMMKSYVNRERILNDAYRYWVLGDLTVKDDHTWAGMITL